MSGKVAFNRESAASVNCLVTTHASASSTSYLLKKGVSKCKNKQTRKIERERERQAGLVVQHQTTLI
jgi:hypothetical protein